MWTTNQHLWIAMQLMALRGFEYKSNYVWGKDKISTGRWNRSKHEILLIGTVGSPPCPALGARGAAHEVHDQAHERDDHQNDDHQVEDAHARHSTPAASH